MTDREAAMERADELMLERATQGLSPQQETELEDLLARHPELEDGYELAAAAVELACLEVDEKLPESLRAELEAQGHRFRGDRRGNVAHFPTKRETREKAPPASVTPARSWAQRSGWWAAAACLALAAVGWWLALRTPELDDGGVPRPQVVTYELPAEIETPAEQRRALLESTDDVLVLEWSATEDPLAQGASGDVVWSPQEQRGYLRFTDLAANDPSEAQYQLWIFDAVRDERFPVDGGVFDVPRGQGEVVVPITAKLPVEQATLFAVTLEPPGGVVVSDRERLVLLAQAS